VEELSCAANQGMQLAPAFEVTPAANGTVKSLGTVNNTPTPTIGTTAKTVEALSNVLLAQEGAKIVDTVSYKYLTAGETYTLKGVIMDKETISELKVNGSSVTAEKTFTVSDSYTTIKTEKSGSVDVTFTFDATGLDGKTLVVYEELYDSKGNLVAEHKDINDAGQTILVPEIGTTALDSETNDHISKADEEITLIDTVSYTNLIAEKEYTVTGTLMDKETGEAMLDDEGNVITAEASFTAEAASGSVDVTFTFSGANLAGKSVVVFEDLYFDGKLYAAHASLDDGFQTVVFPDIHTIATDSETEDHISKADEDITLIDTVSYTNLISGKEYTVTGTLMDKATGEVLLDDNGVAITAETSFTAKAASGSVDVTFTFSGANLTGKTTVVFETLEYNGVEVATHADIEDEGQTVHFTEIHTNATNEETETHTAYPSTSVTIVDAVSYSNLLVGKEYTITGTLVNKKTGEPILDNGVEVTALKTFTAEQESGTEDLTFTFNASALAGESIVAFETFTYKGKEVASHTDLNDRESDRTLPEGWHTGEVQHRNQDNKEVWQDHNRGYGSLSEFGAGRDIHHSWYPDG
jgi:hypothetical protein